jgi:hypothetical protein
MRSSSEARKIGLESHSANHNPLSVLQSGRSKYPIRLVKYHNYWTWTFANHLYLSSPSLPYLNPYRHPDQYAINPQHRHDEAHEHARDAKLEAIRDAHRFRSFAPIRGGNIVKFAVDGYDYFWQLSEIIEGARESVFIMDW